MSERARQAIRDLLILRLKATATIHAQVGAAADGALRKAFLDSASLMLEAADALKATAQ